MDSTDLPSSEIPDSEWNPHAQSVREDLLAACDHMRKHQPVVYHDEQQWYLFRHGDVLRVVEDHERFSNVVSTHLSVPNGMDPPEHTAYRPLIESFFDAQHMGDFEPRCRELSRKLLQELQGRSEVEVVSELAQPFALRVQCSFLSWPDSMEEKLGRWFASNQKAIREQDRAALAEHAEEFSNCIHDLLEERRHADTGDGGAAVDDVTDRLRRSKVQDRLLSDEEIVSILRNWTAGEVGTIAASVGILLHFLAENDEILQRVRAAPEKLPEAIDEILRLHGPLVANRRVTRCPVNIGGREIPEGARLSVLWISANRIATVFEDARQFRWGRDQSKNLLYGAGIHVCPGAPLARLELRVIMEEILRSTDRLQLSDTPVKAAYPASGYARLMLNWSWKG